ncbi:hypothetical protein PHMEG_00033997, partial [Phytophthora megakarya]
MCDYLNRLNGYARNAGVPFENGGREAKDHVEHFLDTCDDRDLEGRLCHVRVKDIHDLEDMISAILKRRDQKSKRDSSVRRSSGQDGSHRRDNGRNEDSRSNYRRDDLRRYKSPYRPRINLAEALSDLVTVLNETSVGPQTSQQGSYDHEFESNEDSFGDGERRDDEGSNRVSEYDYVGEDGRGHIAAANDHGRRAVAEDTFIRSDNRHPKGDGHFNNDRDFARDNRNGRQQGFGFKSGTERDITPTPRPDCKAATKRETRILLDTGANVSVISAAYAKRRSLREVSENGRSLEVRGINPGVLETRRRTLVKITLGWERVYEFEMWIMDHSAGVLGGNFMIPAGVRLDLFYGTARQPRMTNRMESKSSVDRPGT